MSINNENLVMKKEKSNKIIKHTENLFKYSRTHTKLKKIFAMLNQNIFNKFFNVPITKFPVMLPLITNKS